MAFESPSLAARWADLLAEAQRDAVGDHCKQCGGVGRVTMHYYDHGGYEMGWLCWTCEPDERRFWRQFIAKHRGGA